MAIFKCKMCGGTIEFEQGATVGVCDSCGTKQTLPRLDDDKKANLYDRANHFRRNNDFDKAMSIYEQILNEDNTDAEAYWSLVLCRYGIEYVEDPATHKRIPTVNRAQFTSIYMDEDYKSALQYADGYQKTIYEEEAKAIDEIQKGILEISSKEEPFDVFICYKETDASGRRTQDSVLANDLYHQLTQEGFKVFFSRITLEDKLGTAYEPYIFAALNSSKVMVVLGTKPEFFNAVWVKNEWSRYLALIKNGAKKMIIPAYRDMDPYDLPEEFSHLQALDMSKLGFMQDLIRGIGKILNTFEPHQQTQTQTVVVSENANVAPLLERVFLFLEDGKWQDANIYCEKVLDIDPKNTEAYVGKLMAELNIGKRQQLADCKEPFNDSENFAKIIRFGDEKTESEMRGYIAHINERNENERRMSIYNDAIAALNSAYSVDEYYAIINKFRSIHGYKDSDEHIAFCERRIEEIREKQEADRKEAERKAEEARIAREKFIKKAKRVAAIAVPSACAVVVFLIILFNVIIPNVKYNNAVDLMNEGKNEEAIAIFRSLDGYKDSNEKINSLRVGHSISQLKDSEVGDFVVLGAYEQDNNISNGKEIIAWRVLAKDGDNVLLISDKALDSQEYDLAQHGNNTTWEECALRSWLNNSFLNDAFNLNEQSKIVSTTVVADKNPKYGTEQSNTTTDKVFLLGINEIEKYFPMDEDRKCAPTEYAKAKATNVNGNKTVDDENLCRWWLRTLGRDGYYALTVSDTGIVGYYGDPYMKYNYVRPAIWVNVSD